jgi:ATP-dependent helicase/nuclease subunit B
VLQLILGAAGTGKTVEIYRRIAEDIRSGREAVLLVPEQFSFESERALCLLLGEQQALKVQVLSFTRLCHKIFYRYGQVAGSYVDATARYLLMSIALEEVQGELDIYRTQAARASFVPVMLEMVSEFKNAGAAPDAVLAASKTQEDERLCFKLRELGIIYTAYQALLEKSFYDPADDIARALALCGGKGFFSGASIYIDAFTAFMAPELRLIEQMLSENARVTAAVCSPTAADDSEGMGVFSAPGATVRRLMNAARRSGSAIASPVILTEQHRIKEDALCHLERCYLQEHSRYTEGQTAIRLIEAADPIQEVERAARTVSRLVHEEGMRYREIAIVARSMESYGDALCDVFGRYHIPFYLDRRENVESFMLINLLLSALLAVRAGYDSAQLITLSKLPLLGISQEDACEMENYCFIWSIRGKMWLSPFRNHPDGLAGRPDEAALERLERIERARSALIAPLIPLQAALREATGSSFAQALWQYLIDSGAKKRLEELCAVSASGEYVDIQSALYDGVIEILDRFDALIGERRLGAVRLIELFRLAVQAGDVGSLPQTLDQVLAGTADRIRPGAVRAVLILGAAEGDFPLRLDASGILSDRERLLMQRSGVSLNTSFGELAALERFYSYFALTLPSERLIVSWSRRTLSGEGKRESVIVRELRALFGQSLLWPEDPLEGIYTRQAALSFLCAHWGENSALGSSLQAYFAGSPEEEKMKRAVAFAEDKQFRVEDPAVARTLFGSRMALSPSRLERYFSCPFSYFCDSGLRLRQRRRVEYSPLESGSLVHYVLEVLLRKYGPDEAVLPPTTALREEVAGRIGEYLQSRMEDVQAVGERFHYQFTRLRNMLARLIVRLKQELSQSDFLPYAFELPIRPQEENRPVVLTTPGGNTVYVQGIVDRVDLLESADGRYLRVVDYKSGTKKFNLTDIYYGLNLQMFIYLFTLSQQGDNRLRGAFPAGVLYMPAHEEVITVSRDTPPEEIAALRAEGYRMNGLLLDNLSVLTRMENGLSGMFIPAKLKKDGTLDSHSSVASLQEFGRLHKHIEKLICEMADSLSLGQVQACPVKGEGHDPCLYCDYRPICRVEEKHARRILEKLPREELMQRLKEEEQGGS